MYSALEERMQIGVIQHIQTVVTLMIPLVHLIIDGLVQVVVTLTLHGGEVNIRQ